MSGQATGRDDAPTEVGVTELGRVELGLSGRTILVLEEISTDNQGERVRLVLRSVPRTGNPYNFTLPGHGAAELERALHLFVERHRARHVAKSVVRRRDQPTKPMPGIPRGRTAP